MKTVLIVGGGFAGIAAAISFKGSNLVRFILVDRKEYFEVTPAQLHAIVDPGATGKRSRIPYEDIIGDSFAFGEVVGMEDRSARLADGRRIAFDTAIIATGTKYPKFPMAKPLGQSTIALRDSHNEQEHGKFLASESFLVIGGGVVGVELAGELAAYAPGKRVRLAHGGTRLTENLSAKASALALAHLRELGVKVELGTMDARPDPGEAVYLTVSPEPATEFLASVNPGILDAKRLIRVDEYLRVKGRENWYAVGDATDFPDAKQAATADKQGAYVARAILAGFGSKVRAPRPYKIGTTPILVPIGANRGFAQLPFGLVTWKGLVDIKRKDYMIGMFRKKLGIRG
jgi:NADH dehydrogenase FAD-containing subunit